MSIIDAVSDISCSSDRSLAASASAEEFAFRYGRPYDAYIVTEPGWEYFWSRDHRGMVAITARGRYLHIVGGLLAPEEHRAELLEQLVHYAEARELVLTFFNVAEDELPLLRRYGFEATKWGEEALVDLADCTFAGGSYAWVRRQANFCRRHGLVVAECRVEQFAPEAWQRLSGELLAISRDFLASKPQAGEFRLLTSRFDPQHLGHKRLFVVRGRGGNGRIEAFLACNPCRAGATWVMETYRQRPDAVRGAIPFLLSETMRVLKEEGVPQVSLCLIPGLRCAEPSPGDSGLARWGLVVGTRHFGLIFDTAGAYHFKSRFRPRFENRYLCVRPKMTFASGWNMVCTLGVLQVDPRKLWQILCRRWQKRATRGTLKGFDLGDESPSTVGHKPVQPLA